MPVAAMLGERFSNLVREPFSRYWFQNKTVPKRDRGRQRLKWCKWAVWTAQASRKLSQRFIFGVSWGGQPDSMPIKKAPAEQGNLLFQYSQELENNHG